MKPTLTFTDDNQQWRFPLAGMTSLKLAHWFVEPNPTLLEAIVLSDPLFAVWILTTTNQHGIEFTKLSDSLSWFSEHALELFSTQRINSEDDDPTPSEFEQDLVQSFQVVELSHHSANKQGFSAGELTLPALIWNVDEWSKKANHSRVSILNHLPISMQEILRQLQPAESESATDKKSKWNVISQTIQIVKQSRPFPTDYPTSQEDFTKQVQAKINAWFTAEGFDSLFELSKKLHRFSHQNTRFEQRLEEEKLESLAEFAAGAGHEINNPIANISGRAQLLMREEKDPNKKRDLAMINWQAIRVNEMIADAMLFGRPPIPVKEAVNVCEVVAKVVAALQYKAEAHQTKLTIQHSDAALMAEIDAHQIEIALRAVIDNALEAIGQAGNIQLTVRLFDSSNHAQNELVELLEPGLLRWPSLIEIIIQDDGPGITPEIRRHLFDPFFSGRQAGRGLGLGLSKAWKILKNHQGHIAVQSEVNRGSKFYLWLPIDVN